MNINYVKAVVTAFMSMLAALLGVLYVPVLPIVKQLKTTVEHMGTVEDSGNPEQRE